MNFVVWKGVREAVSAQIARQLAGAIRSGEFKPGEKLPSVRKLKRELGVAYNTVLRAYADLTRMGLAYSVPARGVYVSHEAPAPPPSDDPGRERKHFLKLADAFIVQSERCGLDINDALSEVRLRASIRRRKAAAKELERDSRGRRGREPDGGYS
jgi:DNA-binding transcriptional regulator YhcF (GntR family)